MMRQEYLLRKVQQTAYQRTQPDAYQCSIARLAALVRPVSGDGRVEGFRGVRYAR